MGRENILLEAESFTTVNESQVSEETKEKSNTENGVYVKGMALPFGETSRNGVQYEKESVKQNHEDLQGRTMLFNHKQDWVTGHILNTETTDDGMYFEGDINPNAEMPNGVPVAEAIERGDINSVSIQAFIEQLGEEADEEAVVQDMETEKVAVRDFLEISAVSIPGFPQAEALPEHLQQQGVKPVTEALGVNPESSTEKEENEETEQEEEISKEQYEFAPVPTHVLYDSEEDAMQRAENLGLDDIHEHEMSGQIYYMAGDNHDEWLEAVNRSNPTDNNDEETEAPEFNDLGECISYHMDEKDMNQDQAVAVCKTKMEDSNQDDTTMTEDDTTEQEDDSAQSEQVNQEMFIQFVAEHMEGVEAGDLSDAVGDANFTGLDQGEVAKLLAAEFELDEDVVMDAIGQLEDMENPEGEGDYGDDDEDDPEEETDEEGVEDKDREELEEQVKQQSEKIQELEDRIETFLDNDEGSSKQESPSAEESESSIERRPNFKGLSD